MKLRFEKCRGYWLLRLRNSDYVEVAYATLGLKGLQAEVEFPSDWHEERRAWFRFGFGFGSFCFSLPWPKSWELVDDNYQCSGPRYGFQFFEDLLWIRWGKNNGKSKGEPEVCFNMPWAWKHREYKVLSHPETHPYTYTLRSGEVQQRTATIYKWQRNYTRWWIPFKQTNTSIDVEFSDEVGEKTGSWKGGCISCSYQMKPGETPLQTLRRMEAERTF